MARKGYVGFSPPRGIFWSLDPNTKAKALTNLVVSVPLGGFFGR